MKCKSIKLMLLALFSVLFHTQPVWASSNVSFNAAIDQLVQDNFDVKRQGIEALSSADGTSVFIMFDAMLNGHLYHHPDSNQVYVKENASSNKALHIVSLTDTKTVEIAEGSPLKKIRVNNNLRSRLQELIAIKGLTVDDIDIKKKVVREFIRAPKVEHVQHLESAYVGETNSSLKALLNIAIASATLNAPGDKGNISDLLSTVSHSGEIETVGVIKQYLSTPGITPNDKKIAQSAIKRIEGKKKRNKLFENIFFGLSLGSVLLLASIGLAITFGVMGVINMAHGEMIMLGAYTTYVVQQIMPNALQYSLWVSIPAAFIVTALVGMLIERLVIRHLYGRPLETLLATFGISLILQQAVRSVFSPLNRQVLSPDWMMGSLEVNSMLSLTYNRLYILVFSLMVLFFVMLVMRKTSLGLHMRAVTQNRAMANSMGIKSSRIDALTFGLGSGIAGVAGVALSQLTNVGPNLGQAYIIDSFMVVVFGGVGNLFGTLFAAMSLGAATKFIEPYAGAVMAKILILVFIILFIQWRPRGLFALKGRFVED
ncbi:MAG: urea ABC transporter permease subunit UrtB [Pseudomonadota bacterium]